MFCYTTQRVVYRIVIFYINIQVSREMSVTKRENAISKITIRDFAEQWGKEL